MEGSREFDLLCLQEDEYYFRDYACQFSVAAKSDFQSSSEVESTIATAGASSFASSFTLQIGVLKLCSSSIYFVPKNLDDPVVRIPLDCVVSLEDHSSEEDGDLNATIQFSTMIRIQRGLRAVPYTTDVAPTIDDNTHFSANLNFPSSVDLTDMKDFPEKLRQLWSISKLRSGGGKEQQCSATEQLHSLIKAYEAGVDFDSTVLFKENQTEDILEKFRGFRVSPLLIQPGFIVLSQENIYFQPYSCLPASAASETQKWSLDNVNVKYGNRKFQLKNVALEVFFDAKVTAESSLFVAFESTEDRNAFQTALIEKAKVATSTSTTTTPLNQIRKSWRDGKISNYEYLVHLNEYAGRSLNDLTQYLVFPWVVQDYSSTVLDLNDPSTFRDLSRPIAAFNQARVRHGREMYAALQSTGGDEPPWMYGSHYSNPGLVVYYLLRQRPQWMLRLQNGKFDAPDRLFSSISGTWESVLRWNSDVKELIPEFYTLNPQNSFLINSTGTDLGRRASGETVNDVELPPWASSPEDFIKKMRSALESPFVSAKLHKWIDLIFGVKQRGRRAVDADNVFHFMTDDETALRYVQGEKDVGLKSAFEAQIREYGRTPLQLFSKKHPRRKGESRISRMLQACTCGGPSSGPAATSTGTRGVGVSNRPETLQ